MHSGVTIRRFTDQDIEDYTSTLLRTLPCESIEEARENVEIILKRVEEREELWVAEIDGHAVGFALLDFTKTWGDESQSFDEEGVCVDWLDVNPEFQRKGIGTALLAKTMERARDKGLRRVFMHTAVDNAAMLRFSEKNGFRVTRSMRLRWGEGFKDGVLLENMTP